APEGVSRETKNSAPEGVSRETKNSAPEGVSRETEEQAFGLPEQTDLLGEFLAQAALEAGEQQADAWESCVQLMTLHAAKGLEFPLVFMVGVEEGLFPSQQVVDEGGRLEEERRLAYVGITRAEQQLIITYANRRRLHGNEFYPLPSRFIREIPAECVELVRMSGQVRPTSQAPVLNTSVQAALAAQRPADYQIGHRVRHEKFGEGIVLNMEGAGDHARVNVFFEQAGAKWLVMAYAKLERC
ncbi:MAG: ATP-binding domain-containing protein, partial [Gammaproteobacteria bacterium]|nr:ATP-binding domain-containing protein [Gammaproteobacteria bacterium]